VDTSYDKTIELLRGLSGTVNLIVSRHPGSPDTTAEIHPDPDAGNAGVRLSAALSN